MSPPLIHLTKHATARGAQRLHLDAERLAAKAAQVLQTGRPLEGYDGLLRAYLEKTQRQYRASDLRVFGRELWVFRRLGADALLITVATVPRPLMERLARLAVPATGPP